jgi:hypothetical protein
MYERNGSVGSRVGEHVGIATPGGQRIGIAQRRKPLGKRDRSSDVATEAG